MTGAGRAIAVMLVLLGTVSAGCSTPATRQAPVGLGSAAGTYQYRDGSEGRAMAIVPPGEDGLVTSADLAGKTTPQHSNDAIAPYNNFVYGSSGLTDATLSNYYGDESFGVKPADVVRTERPDPKVRVVIYRDTSDVPHVYGASTDAMAFGAGYAGAEDRLFFMDVLRHYGRGTLTGFLGTTCDFEQKDFTSVTSNAYTESDLQSQLDSLAAHFGSLGAQLRAMIHSYVEGVNRYIADARQDPSKMPAEYAATHSPPQPFTDTDVIAVATLIGLEATGGGQEVQNAALVQYLANRTGSGTAASHIFSDLKEQNDPAAPVTIATPYPYMIPATVDPALTAMPDNAAAPLTGGPVATVPGCTGPVAASTTGAPNSAGAALSGSTGESNAVVISAARSADGHPIAVFGPELGYFAPEILMEEDLHSPGYDAAGAAFPGANFVVELGRGTDYAWSATTASTDQTDMRVEKICDPAGGAPQAQGTSYLFDGQCRPMGHRDFVETWPPPSADPPPSGVTTIDRSVFTTEHGVVQGWTTVGGAPVAIVRQTSTSGHDIDQFVGFLRWGMPALTHDAASWMQGAADVAYSFNWFYLDTKDIAYYVSGRDPIRNPRSDPNLPTWGTGADEWQGYLSFGSHPHAVNPPSGYLVSWNNKSAPLFSASDDLFAFGPVHRSQMLSTRVDAAFAQDNGKAKLTRAQVASLVEDAATEDLSAASVIPRLLSYMGDAVKGTPEADLLQQLSAWNAAGDHRLRLSPSDTQYQFASAIAIWDELYPRLVEAFFDPVFVSGGTGTYDSVPNGYSTIPMLWSETPNDVGQHDGDGFYSGWYGYLVKVFQTLDGTAPTQPLSDDLLSQLCAPLPVGPPGTMDERCARAIMGALSETQSALVKSNGGATTASTWTQDSATAYESSQSGRTVTMPEFDDIQFNAVGLLTMSAMDWVNRPTYQQVVEFPRRIS